jgi:hypothetical protein
VFIGLADDQRAWIGLTLAALATDAAENEISLIPPGQVSVVSQSVMPAPPSASSRRRQRLLDQIPSMLARLERELVDIEGKTPWDLLGIAQNADPETARRAFLALCKRYHPHTYARFDSAEVSRMATQLFIAHKRAYTKLASLRPPAPLSSQAPERLVPTRVRSGVG